MHDLTCYFLSLQGFLKRNSYIITQMPLPHTVIDFWRMVYEHGCNSIVMLNSMDDGDEVRSYSFTDYSEVSLSRDKAIVSNKLETFRENRNTLHCDKLKMCKSIRRRS